MTSHHPLVVELSKLNAAGDVIRGEVSVSVLDIGEDRRVRLKDPLRFDLQTQHPSGELIVQGSLEVICDQECGRCTDFYSTTVSVSSFLRAYEILDCTDTVDLTADIREDILLAIPSFPLCSDDCKGLCPQCGKNLNEGPCTCKPVRDEVSPWTALEDLGLPEEK